MDESSKCDSPVQSDYVEPVYNYPVTTYPFYGYNPYLYPYYLQNPYYNYGYSPYFYGRRRRFY
jgi:hypothetical protein